MFLYNGQITPEPAIELYNRAFRYGDAFFETMLFHDGSIPLLRLHFERAAKTLKQLKMQTSDDFSFEGLAPLLYDFLRDEEHPTAKVRISFWRNGHGTYLPHVNTVSYLVEAAPISNKPFVLNEKGLVLGVYKETYKNTDFIANLKTIGCLTYTLASMWVRENGVDDAVLLNSHGRIAECTSSNIFIVCGNEISTPPLSEGCLDGVMRRHLLATLPNKGFNIKEQPIEIADLHQADEVFITNALGVKWIGKIGEKSYPSNKVAAINALLSEVV